MNFSKTWPAADCGQIPKFCGTESVHPTRNQRSQSTSCIKDMKTQTQRDLNTVH